MEKRTGVAAKSSDVEERCLYSDVSIRAPSVKVSYRIKREISISEACGSIQLGHQRFKEAFQNNNLIGHAYLNDCEVHVIWRSLCPSTIYDNPMEMSLDFNPATEFNNQIIQMGKFPMNVFVKCIFHPGHSIYLSMNDLIPWSVSYNIAGLDIQPGYKIGKINIEVRGYISPVLTSVNPAVPEMIPLMPQDWIPEGLVFFRPRIVEERIWMVRKMRSIISVNTVLKEKKLREAGYDVEGLRMIGLLPKVLRFTKIKGMFENDDIKRINEIIGQNTSRVNSLHNSRLE